MQIVSSDVVVLNHIHFVSRINKRIVCKPLSNVRMSVSSQTDVQQKGALQILQHSVST
jgi:hypothetical protein